MAAKRKTRKTHRARIRSLSQADQIRALEMAIEAEKRRKVKWYHKYLLQPRGEKGFDIFDPHGGYSASANSHKEAIRIVDAMMGN